MAKKSSYQKLKKKIEKLHSDIRTIVKFPDSPEAEQLKKKYLLMYEMEDAAWSGDRKSTESHGGILKLMRKTKK